MPGIHPCLFVLPTFNTEQATSHTSFRHHFRYQIVRKLGEGVLGIVIEAIDTNENERVAFKISRSILTYFLATKKEGMFLRKMNMCKKSKQSGVIGFMDAFVEEIKDKKHQC